MSVSLMERAVGNDSGQRLPEPNAPARVLTAWRIARLYLERVAFMTNITALQSRLKTFAYISALLAKIEWKRIKNSLCVLNHSWNYSINATVIHFHSPKNSSQYILFIYSSQYICVSQLFLGNFCRKDLYSILNSISKNSSEFSALTLWLYN